MDRFEPVELDMTQVEKEEAQFKRFEELIRKIYKLHKNSPCENKEMDKALTDFWALLREMDWDPEG